MYFDYCIENPPKIFITDCQDYSDTMNNVFHHEFELEFHFPQFLCRN